MPQAIFISAKEPLSQPVRSLPAVLPHPCALILDSTTPASAPVIPHRRPPPPQQKAVLPMSAQVSPLPAPHQGSTAHRMSGSVPYPRSSKLPVFSGHCTRPRGTVYWKASHSLDGKPQPCREWGCLQSLCSPQCQRRKEDHQCLQRPCQRFCF